MIKKIVITAAGLVLAIVLNGVFFLFSYQYKTVEKIDRGGDTNLYEKFSILTLHAGLYTVGSLYCPDAAYAHLKMLTSRQDTVYLHSDRWLTPRVKARFAANRLGRITWNGNVAYAIDSKEKNAAILLNPCYLSTEVINGKPCYTATCPYTWRQQSETKFDLGFMTITVFEQLFYELEKCGILHPYTLVCYTEK